MRKEESEHLQICNYIKAQYPDVIFTSDASGVRMPIGLSVKFSKLKSGRGIPDLLILEPRGDYSGLFLEIKRTDEKIFKKDGTLRTDKHLKEQAKILDRLKHKGYATYFAIGTTRAIEIIDDYMKSN
jgi:hypothetical protein